MDKVRKRVADRILRAVRNLLVLALLGSLLQVVAFRFLNPPFTVNMVYEWVLGTYFNQPYVKPVFEWKDLGKISVHLRKAVLASEDQRFLNHHGFDFLEIQNVLEEIRAGQGMRGASTISMQAARSLFLPASRSVVRKAAEAWYTILIELFWSKERILEIYLNTVDWGTGIVGAQAGARSYFATDAGRLSPSQAALMAAVLPSPHKWSVTNPGKHVTKRQRWILGQMAAMPALSPH